MEVKLNNEYHDVQHQKPVPHVQRVINETTLMPLRIVIPLIATLIGVPFTAYLWAESRLQELEEAETKKIQLIHDDIGVIKQDINNLKTSIDLQSKKIEDRWTLSDQVIWYLELKQKNPTLDIPDPRKSAAIHVGK